MSEAYIPYAPLDRLKPFADDIWIVDGPEIGFRYAGVTLPFPTRMTAVRLPSGDLWIHSPIAWSDALASGLDALGRVRHLVAPNTIHYIGICPTGSSVSPKRGAMVFPASSTGRDGGSGSTRSWATRHQGDGRAFSINAWSQGAR